MLSFACASLAISLAVVLPCAMNVKTSRSMAAATVHVVHPPKINSFATGTAEGNIFVCLATERPPFGFSANKKTAVHDDIRAGDEIRRVRGQEDRRTRHLGRLGEAARGRPQDHFIFQS